ncbi:DoxX family membrane protein [Natrinema sp. 74]|uniref:DoxX family membrane protein n=1 Tax=Natrinema sp. 74 TaxID=3384159 RepID=UPI0038D4EFC5
MLEALERHSTSEPASESVIAGNGSNGDAGLGSTAFLVGRLLYGGILTMMAVDGLRNADERAEYAAAKNVPMPELATNASHALLLGGGIGITLWRAPALAASAVATFFLGVTPAMHDFWTVDDPEQRQQQLTHFLKNVALLGTALALLGLAEGET